MLLQANFVNRRYFGKFLNDRGLKGLAAEVGTHRGAFASTLLQHWDGERLYCIDPWTNGYNSIDPVSNRTLKERLDDYQAARILLFKYKDRCTILREESEVAAHKIADSSLDFVYIDGNHHPDFFSLDLRLWWAKVKSRGIVAGHDFICPNEPNGGWGRGIQEKLLPFASEKFRDIFIVLEADNSPWSFYMEK